MRQLNCIPLQFGRACMGHVFLFLFLLSLPCYLFSGFYFCFYLIPHTYVYFVTYKWLLLISMQFWIFVVWSCSSNKNLIPKKQMTNKFFKCIFENLFDICHKSRLFVVHIFPTARKSTILITAPLVVCFLRWRWRKQSSVWKWCSTVVPVVFFNNAWFSVYSDMDSDYKQNSKCHVTKG